MSKELTYWVSNITIESNIIYEYIENEKHNARHKIIFS